MTASASTNEPSCRRQVQTRMLDAAMTWFLTVNPAAELLGAALQSDAFAHGLVPSPYQIVHSTVARLCSRTVSCLVTSFFAPRLFPYPWAERSECLDSEGNPHSTSSITSSCSPSYLHHFRHMATLFYFTNDNLVQHMFNRLVTTKLVNWFSDTVDGLLFRRLRRVMRASLLAVDRFFGVDHLPAYTYEHVSSDLNKQQADINNFSTMEAMERLEEREKKAEEQFNKHVFDTLGDVAEIEGPVRAVLYRNAIPMLTYFIQTQALWMIMSAMSKFKIVRKLLVGRFFHRSAVVPYSQLWKMHLSETLVNVVEIGMSLFARIVGALVGFYSFKLLTSNSDFIAYYVSVADGALVGEQFLGHYLTKGFRSYASFWVHHNLNEIINARFPLNEEVFKKEMDDLSDVHFDENEKDEEHEGENNNDQQEEDKDDESEKSEDEIEEEEQETNKLDDDDQQQEGIRLKKERKAAAREERARKREERKQQQRQSNGKSSNQQRRKPPKEIDEEDFDHVSRQAIFTTENYYEHLGVTKTATQEEIRKAFRRQAILFHPDRLASKSPQEQAEGMTKFKKVQQSYEVLSNEQRRKEYDFAQAQGLFETPEIASAREHQRRSNRGPPPNPFAAFFGSSRKRNNNNTKKEKKKNAFGEEEEEIPDDHDDSDDENAEPDAYAEYQYHNQPRPHGLHPAHVVGKYFEFVDRVVGEENVKAQKVVYGLSSATALGMMFVVMHQHAANQYQEFLKPGV